MSQSAKNIVVIVSQHGFFMHKKEMFVFIENIVIPCLNINQW